MRITVASVMVDDQAKAQCFYTDVLGFVMKRDIDLGDARWLTVVSPDALDSVELLLEPNWNPEVPAKAWQKSLFDAGIPATAFEVDDVQAEYTRLSGLGVVFRGDPTENDGITMATFEDTCGNLIMITSPS